MIPNGVILIDVNKSEITFANSEIRAIVGALPESSFSEIESKVKRFKIKKVDVK